jgi:hypothetical protein
MVGTTVGGAGEQLRLGHELAIRDVLLQRNEKMTSSALARISNFPQTNTKNMHIVIPLTASAIREE